MNKRSKKCYSQEGPVFRVTQAFQDSQECPLVQDNQMHPSAPGDQTDPEKNMQ